MDDGVDADCDHGDDDDRADSGEGVAGQLGGFGVGGGGVADAGVFEAEQQESEHDHDPGAADEGGEGGDTAVATRPATKTAAKKAVAAKTTKSRAKKGADVDETGADGEARPRAGLARRGQDDAGEFGAGYPREGCLRGTVSSGSLQIWL